MLGTRPTFTDPARGIRRWALSLVAGCCSALCPAVALGAGWTVTVRAHHIEALSNSDNWGEQDMYWRAHLKATVGSGGPVDCDTEDDHPDDDNSFDVDDWACTLNVVGGTDTTVQIHLEVWDED